MVGPNELFASMYAATARWPLEAWGDGRETFIECGACGSGRLVRAKNSLTGKQFVLVELITALAAHIPLCVGLKTGKVSDVVHD